MPGCDPVQPDVLVVRADQASILRDDKHIQGVPALIVEVLSPGNADTDTRIKRAAYARAGVPEYWMFRPASRDALQCWRPDRAMGDYAESKLSAATDELVAATLPLRLRLANIFEGAPNTLL
jgi:Uma2 family endonuclease